MSEYAAKVAHELRTPLAILRLKVEQAGDRIPPELAEQLQAELHQLTHVVDQSLLIAKAEQGRLKLQPRELDLAQLVLDVAEDFTLLAQEAGRTVRLVALNGGVVLTDPKYTKQMLHNLLTNAFKHGQGDIRVKLTRRQNRLVLTIANWLRAPNAPNPEALGLGLRVVETLLSLQPNVKCLRRRNPRGYAVRLSFPATAVTRLTSAPLAANQPAFDVSI
jgi:K+-sensing histidine kinase KdpD